MAERGQVIQLDSRRKRRKRAKTPCPERLTPKQLRSVLNFARDESYSMERVRWAWMAVRGWWESREIPKKDWAAVTRNALKGFWDKAGFPDWMARRSWRGPERVVTQALIEKAIAGQERWYRLHPEQFGTDVYEPEPEDDDGG
jgi:hypothetical protein